VEHHKLQLEKQFVPGVAIVDINSLEPKPGNIPILVPMGTILLGDLPGEEMCRFLALGVNGFVRYSEVVRKLRKAVEIVANGRLYVSRSVLERFVAYTRLTDTAKVSGPLTPRQKQILQLLDNHCTNKEISSHLEISENTVKFHLAKIYSKLGVSDRHTAVNHMRVKLPRGKAGAGAAASLLNEQAYVAAKGMAENGAAAANGQLGTVHAFERTAHGPQFPGKG
jgi:DNA-binding CsgD family transcriptional regulator